MRLKIDPVVAIQLLSHIQLCDPVDCSTPGFPVLHCLSEFAAFYSIPEHLTCLLKTYMQVRKQQLELDMEQQTGSK